MATRTKVSEKSALRRDERMVREMRAWVEANIPANLRDGRLASDRTVLLMIKQAFMAGWRSKNLKEHEPAIASRFDDADRRRSDLE